MSDRVSERRRAAQLALHYREQENLTIAEIARRLGRAEATVKAYLYDPSDANKRPTDIPQERRVLGACWSSTVVDLQAANRLSLRRREAGVPHYQICPKGATRPRCQCPARRLLRAGSSSVPRLAERSSEFCVFVDAAANA